MVDSRANSEVFSLGERFVSWATVDPQDKWSGEISSTIV